MLINSINDLITEKFFHTLGPWINFLRAYLFVVQQIKLWRILIAANIRFKLLKYYNNISSIYA